MHPTSFATVDVAARLVQTDRYPPRFPGMANARLLHHGMQAGPIAAASPISNVNAKTQPLLLIVGDRDMTVPYLQTLEMADAMKTAGASVELVVIPDVDHVFIGKTAEETREANLRALAAMLDFIDRTIGPPNGSPGNS